MQGAVTSTELPVSTDVQGRSGVDVDVREMTHDALGW
jgi:hypothetical protein